MTRFAGDRERGQALVEFSLSIVIFLDPDGVFVLVVGQEPDPGVIVVGWIVGRDGMRREYLEGPNGRPLAWFVPQPALKPFPIEDA